MFVDDGDSSCFAKVRDACAACYDDQYPVVKEERNGHVQKKSVNV